MSDRINRIPPAKPTAKFVKWDTYVSPHTTKKDLGYTDEELASLTVPGQSVSIPDMMKRYEKGRPTPEL